MASNYLPQKLATFLAWSLNFANLITANPGLYGLTAGDATAISVPQAAFSTAYGIAVNPTTRSKTTVNTMTVARNTLVQVIRSYGRIVLSNAGVADADKVALGLKIRDNVNTPIPTPTTNPLITIVGAQPGQLTVRYNDSAAAPGVKAKPFGSTGLELHVFFGNVVPATPAATPFHSIQTRSPFALNTTGGTPGQTAFVYGRWITAKGLPGPWSPLASSVIV